MRWRNLAILIVAILGIVLFLYGSNYYDATTGWSGLFLIAAAIIAYVVWEVYAALRKREG
jgi:hypothetical protein